MRFKIAHMVVCAAMLFMFGHPAAASDNDSECIVLLHGLARSEKSLGKLAKRLSNEGYLVVNNGYPSRQKRIETLAIDTINQAIAACGAQSVRKIHFVTHSMGGILVRYYLAHHHRRPHHQPDPVPADSRPG